MDASREKILWCDDGGFQSMSPCFSCCVWGCSSMDYIPFELPVCITTKVQRDAIWWSLFQFDALLVSEKDGEVFGSCLQLAEGLGLGHLVLAGSLLIAAVIAMMMAPAMMIWAASLTLMLAAMYQHPLYQQPPQLTQSSGLKGKWFLFRLTGFYTCFLILSWMILVWILKTKVHDFKLQTLPPKAKWFDASCQDLWTPSTACFWLGAEVCTSSRKLGFDLLRFWQCLVFLNTGSFPQ